jgi:hypothetical protein
MDSNKIADVLEEAARLYKDEQVDWCSGSWLEAYDWARDEQGEPIFGQSDTEGNLSMCAEGALLRASGVSLEVISEYSEFSGTNQEVGILSSKAPGAAELFFASRTALARHLFTHREESYVGPGAIDPSTNDAVSIPGWNDDLVATIVDQAWNLNGPAHEQATPEYIRALSYPNEVAKSVVIDAMDATAKDLRNG